MRKKYKNGIAFGKRLNALMDRAGTDQDVEVRIAVCDVLCILNLAQYSRTRIVKNSGEVTYCIECGPTSKLLTLMGKNKEPN